MFFPGGPPPGTWYWSHEARTGNPAMIQAPPAYIPPVFAPAPPQPIPIPIAQPAYAPPVPTWPGWHVPSPQVQKSGEGKWGFKSVNLPHGLQAGEHIMWGGSWTKINFLKGGVKAPWECDPKDHEFVCARIPRGASMRDVLDHVSGGSGKGWALTEIFELGDGKFEQGQTWEYDDDKQGKMSVADAGFSEKAGYEMPVVWAWVRKL
ncbi:hypothetical protein LTS18_003895 [Coniosporium uncinatum]|uniref:Uncharacterized protein n=1 Tax=Coniosporium uncinatum TaxID=93489 RepID=A0ACC3DSY7_9PEZI|nr:hypothetical protein LTS18_003895 [Coniosporium uncinatum]